MSSSGELYWYLLIKDILVIGLEVFDPESLESQIYSVNSEKDGDKESCLIPQLNIKVILNPGGDSFFTTNADESEFIYISSKRDNVLSFIRGIQLSHSVMLTRRSTRIALEKLMNEILSNDNSDYNDSNHIPPISKESERTDNVANIIQGPWKESE